MGTRRQSLVGLRSGRLTVIRIGEVHGYKAKWLCRCECGNTALVWSYSLRSGRTKSCGCLKDELSAERSLVHGHTGRGTRSSEYNSWDGMNQRCHNTKNPSYRKYGGRGIRVCARWRASFANFIADMGRKPSPQHSIDRIDNDGNYEPGNCRWATLSQQNSNMQRSKGALVYKGECGTFQYWAAKLGVTPSALCRRLNAGWSLERTLTTPRR